MSSSLLIRTEPQSTSSFVETVIAYAELSSVNRIRLVVTKRYVEGEALPEQDFSLVHNSPLLLVLVEMNLPSIATGVHIVHDYSGLSIQRDNREAEVRNLLTYLLEIAPEKIVFSTHPVEATMHMRLEEAAQVLRSSDYVQLTAQNQSDLLRRMRGY